MINRFNFYDIYGYLIPGLVFLVLLWLPYGLATGPPKELSSVLLAVVMGYVVGHVLQNMADVTFPSARPRYPSDRILDKEDNTFSAEIRERLWERIRNRFGIDVSGGADADDKSRRRRRYDGFMLCRATLIQNNAAPYAEQFEGMYALMRGLLATFLLSASYYLGWLLKSFLHQTLFYGLLWAVAATAVVLFVLRLSTKLQIDNWWFWLVAGLVFVLGGSFGMAHGVDPQTTVMLWVLFGIFLFLAYRCHCSYLRWTNTFAASVYRNFIALADGTTGATQQSGTGQQPERE